MTTVLNNPSYPVISFGLDDTNIKNGISSLTAAGNPVRIPSDLTDIQNGVKVFVPYATYEPDEWVLDGTYHFMPNLLNAHVGYFGTVLSGATGVIVNDTLTIAFSSSTAIDSITLHFDQESNNWCSDISITFLWGGGGRTYNHLLPSSYDFTLSSIGVSCTSMSITFNNTNNPYRFTRLKGIDFNAVTYLDKTKIKAATITEEFSPISETLTANKLEFELLPENADFDVLNPNSLYASLPNGMPFRCYEVVDNVSNLMGVFFLDTWENTDATNQVVKFDCIDAIGLCQRLPFYGWVSNVRDFLTMMTYALSSVSNITYTGDANVLSGNYQFANWLTEPNANQFIDPCSLSDFIQRCCSALHLGVTTRNGYLYFSSAYDTAKIPKRASVGSQDYSITISQEIITKVSLIPLISGIKLIRTKTGVGGGTPINIYSQSLAAGNYIIPFPEMRAGINSITGATLNTPANWTVVGAFDYDINVSSPGTVTISDFGRMEDDPSNVYKKITTLLAIIANAPTDKYAEVDTTLIASSSMTSYISNANLYDTCQVQWIGDYFLGHYFQDATVLGVIVHAGDLVLIDSNGTKKILGIIEENTINLIGLRSDVHVVGVVV